MPTDPQTIADQLAASESATLFLDVKLDDAMRKTLMDDYQIFSEHDLVRDVDAVREATDEEIAESVAAAAAASTKPATAPKAGATTTSST
jgi:hypothetical protein